MKITKKSIGLFLGILVASTTLIAQTPATYKSKLMPVSFKHTSNWEAEDVQEDGLISINSLKSTGFILIRTDSSNLSLKELIKRTNDLNYFENGVKKSFYDLKEGEIIINGQTFNFVEASTNKEYKEFAGEDKPTMELHYFMKKDNRYYYLYSSIKKTHKIEALTIIKSFKLL